MRNHATSFQKYVPGFRVTYLNGSSVRTPRILGLIKDAYHRVHVYICMQLMREMISTVQGLTPGEAGDRLGNNMLIPHYQADQMLDFPCAVCKLSRVGERQAID